MKRGIFGKHNFFQNSSYPLYKFLAAFLFLVLLLASGCFDTNSHEEKPFSGSVNIVLFEKGNPVTVPLKIAPGLDRKARLFQVGKALVKGVKGHRAKPLLIDGAILEKIETEDTGARYYIRVPVDSQSLWLDQSLSDELTSQFINTLLPMGETSASVFFATETSDFLPAEKWIPKPPPVVEKPSEVYRKIPGKNRGGPSHIGSPQYPGDLLGKTVFVSAGHGWHWNGSSWLTQRGNTNDLVEDLSNAEAVDNYLLQYLYNAGANVWPCRERGMNENEVIVDNNDPGFSFTGSWSPSTSVPGYWGSDYMHSAVTAGETATATWTPDIPEDGYYHLYVWYTGGSNRSEDAKFTVRHPGGEVVVEVNQQQDTFTFRHLGKYYFYAGSDATAGSVTLSNQGSDPSTFVIADAVRFGGGTGSVNPGGGTSGRPRWEESGRYFAEFMGCSSCNTGTVSAMPRYAKWESESWEDSLYVSWHTNAPNPGTGTSSFVYSSYGWGGSFTGNPGSQELQDFVHDEIINDIRAGYDSGWYDRGKNSADFGEINPYYNDEMPSMLFEVAFHDTPSDAEDLKQPEFRRIVSRAVYQGIVKYFAHRDGVLYTLLPEPPTDLAVIVTPTSIELSWVTPPYDNGDGLLGDAATGYRIYTSPDGKAFSLYQEVAGKALSVRMQKTADPLYIRLTAVNAGGESLPTEVLAVTDLAGPQSRVLIVNGFDRLDKNQLIDQYESGPLGTVSRMFLDRMNTYDYVRAYADVLSFIGISFDSASNEAALDMDLSLYQCVVWICGEESTSDESLSDDEQALLSAYLDQGGALLISGAEIGWDLDWMGSTSDTVFYNAYLNAQLEADYTGTYDYHGLAGTLFQGLSGYFDDSTHGSYDVEWPDVLTPINGASCVMEFGPAQCAALQYDGLYKLIYFGFPTETIYDKQQRFDLLAAAFGFLVDMAVPPIDLIFFRAAEYGDCLNLEWGVPPSLDAESFMPLFADNEDGYGAVELASQEILADNLNMDYRYSHLLCGPPFDGYYFLDVTMVGQEVWRYGPVQWPTP